MQQYSSEQLLKLSTRKKLVGWRGVRDRRKRLKMLRIQADRARAVGAVDSAVVGVGNAAEAAGMMLEKKTVGKPFWSRVEFRCRILQAKAASRLKPAK